MRFKRFKSAIGKGWNRAGDWLLAGFYFLLALFLYVQTLAPSVATLFDDSLEFPLVAYDLAIAHPTGYPLYTLLGKLFTLAPGPNVAWSVNLLSAVAGALTVVLVYLVVRELGGRRLPALLGAIALMVSPVFWSQAIIAEVYTLSTLFVAGLLWLALRWSRRPLLPIEPFSLLLHQPQAQRGLFLPEQGMWMRLPEPLRKLGWRVRAFYRRLFPKVPAKERLRIHPILYALVGLFGLSLTHHRITLLLVPALFIFVVAVERKVLSRAALLGPEHPERPIWRQVLVRPVVLLALCLLAPLLLYLYLPLRGQVGSLDGLYSKTWSGFWQWVMASGYGAFFGDNPLARDLDAAFYAQLFWRQFGPVGLALALVGLAGLLRRPKAMALTGLAFFTFVVFAVVYRVPDVEVFFVPAFLVTAVWIGFGLDHAANLLRVRGKNLALRRLLAICVLLLFVAALVQPILIAARNYSEIDLSQRWIVHDYGRYVLEQPLPQDSTIVGVQGEITLLRYFQRTESLRPDIEMIAAYDEEARLTSIEAALARRRNVYVTRSLAGLAEAHSLGAVIGLIDVLGDEETLVAVGEPVFDPPDLPRPTDLEIVPGLKLLGYGVREHRAHWRAWARLRLWWQAPEGLLEPFSVSARLLNDNSQVVSATDAAPVAWTYPATSWWPDEVVADAYEIPLPTGLPPGEYRPLVIVYDPKTGVEWGRAELGSVFLEGNPTRPPYAALEESVDRLAFALFGDVELLGFTPPSLEPGYLPGDRLPLTLLWQARSEPTNELAVTFWLEANGEEYSLGSEPLGGSFPAALWATNQVVRQWPVLQVPENIPTETYQLKLRVTRDGQPVPWGRWLIPLGSDLVLGDVMVNP